MCVATAENLSILNQLFGSREASKNVKEADEVPLRLRIDTVASTQVVMVASYYSIGGSWVSVINDKKATQLNAFEAKQS